MRVAGVDSCRGGWIAVTYDTDDRVLTPRVEVSFMALLERLRDAVAAAWTARRVVEGVAERLPAEPAVDRRGLRMEMVFRSIACMIPRTNTGGVELAYWRPVKSSMEIGVDFDWDPVQDRANEGKHGISFDDAKAVFLDAQHLIEDATRPEHGERRSKAIGRVGSAMMAVIFTDRGDHRRLISARRARRDERERYRQSAESS